MSTRTLRVEMFRDASKKWRWRSIGNGNILADSGYGYSRRVDALRGMCRVHLVRRWDGQPRPTTADRAYVVHWYTNAYAQAVRADGSVIDVVVVES